MTKQRRLKGLIIYLIIGILAVLTMYPMQKAALEAQIDQLPIDPGMSLEMVALLSMLNPLFLLLIALLIGYFVADKVGLKSIVIHAKKMQMLQLKKGLKPAVIGGSLLGIIIILFDIVMRPLLPGIFTGTIQAPSLNSLIAALLYGGIVEELLLRFGLMSLLVLLIWKLFQRKKTVPTKGVYLAAILISAFLFALGHLPATAAMTEMTLIIWIRMLALNGLGGLLFGWLYWKYNLETAMVAHMMAHISMNVLTLIIWLI